MAAAAHVSSGTARSHEAAEVRVGPLPMSRTAADAGVKTLSTFIVSKTPAKYARNVVECKDLRYGYKQCDHSQECKNDTCKKA